MRRPTFYELFAGAGGLSMGLELAGWQCVGHAEIEAHPRAVLRKQWPGVRLDGDVAALDGREIVASVGPITLLSGGSPCQDLSVAGKRAGMTEGSGTRSSLFFEQVRIWDETQAPYLLWENVLGALSSNNGRDFAAVLSALVGSPVTVPSDGWRGAVVWLRDVPESPHGGYWTVSISGLRSAAAVSLSSVLEPEASIPPKYYLSAKACQGILRRALNRGKALPAMLEQALVAATLPMP